LIKLTRFASILKMSQRLNALASQPMKNNKYHPKERRMSLAVADRTT